MRRQVIFQMAEAAVSRELFRTILERIGVAEIADTAGGLTTAGRGGGMGVRWKMDCVDARLTFVAEPVCGRNDVARVRNRVLGWKNSLAETDSGNKMQLNGSSNVPRGRRGTVIGKMR